MDSRLAITSHFTHLHCQFHSQDSTHPLWYKSDTKGTYSLQYQGFRTRPWKFYLFCTVHYPTPDLLFLFVEWFKVCNRQLRIPLPPIFKKKHIFCKSAWLLIILTPSRKLFGAYIFVDLWLSLNFSFLVDSKIWISFPWKQIPSLPLPQLVKEHKCTCWNGF